MRHLLTVVRNEADRYLESCLKWNRSFVDTIFVYDDGSEDDSLDIARSLGDFVVERPGWVPEFTRNEGMFREASLHAFAEEVGPDVGDWVLFVDADEFLVGDIESLNDCSEAAALKCFEMWSINPPLHRVDGYWGEISNGRCMVWPGSARGLVYRKKLFASGSLPMRYRNPTKLDGLHFLHYGYADQADREEKAWRYTKDRSHNRRHLDSILRTPKLEPYDGPLPDVWRGRA